MASHADRVRGIKEEVYEARRKYLSASNMALILILAVLPWIYYSRLPEIVPTHWNWGGQVTSTGSSFNTMLLLSLVMPFANIIIEAIYLARWRILRGYPYLINLPAITVLLGSERINPRDKRRIIEDVFTVMLMVGVLIGIYLLVLEVGILESMRTGVEPSWMLPYTIIGAAAIIIPPLMMYRRIYREEILPLLGERKGL